MKKGFKYKDKTIYLLDCKGKDVSFERWRIAGYYERSRAETLFFDTEKEYKFFIQNNKNDCYVNGEWKDCFNLLPDNGF